MQCESWEFHLLTLLISYNCPTCKTEANHTLSWVWKVFLPVGWILNINLRVISWVSLADTSETNALWHSQKDLETRCWLFYKKKKKKNSKRWHTDLTCRFLPWKVLSRLVTPPSNPPLMKVPLLKWYSRMFLRTVRSPVGVNMKEL